MCMSSRKKMKAASILSFELVFRVGTSVCSLLALALVDYFLFGVQSEYFDGLILKSSQTSSFCFESSYGNFETGLSTYAVPTAHVDKPKPSQWVSYAHQSQSWLKLGLPCLSYFYPLDLNQSYLHLFKWGYAVVLYVTYAILAFLLPCMIHGRRYHSVTVVHVHALIVVTSNLLLGPVLICAHELGIEVYDTELLSL